MKQDTGAARGARIAVRLSREDRDRIAEAVKPRGYTSPSAFIRSAIQNELNGRPELTETEDRIAGGFERMSSDYARIVRGQQALHALLDTFVKTVLTCMPEPSNDARPQAIARAKGPVPPTDQDCRSKHGRRRTRRLKGFGESWHELMRSVRSGYGHRNLVA